MIEIFHIAGLRLGRSFRNLPEARDTLSEARYETLNNCIDKANEKKADIFVIAGSLFVSTMVKIDAILIAG